MKTKTKNKNKNKKNSKPIIAIALVALVGLIGGTLAYFTSKDVLENVFKTAVYSTETSEEFESPTNWIPGTTTNKKIFVTNTGSTDVAVRVSYTETWVSQDGTPLALQKDGKDVAVINFTNPSDWIKVTDTSGVYYYYKYKLAPGNKTTSFIESVRFNEEVDLNVPCTPSPNKNTCTNNGKGYDGATYTLTITTETVQFDVYREYWNTSASISNSSKS